MKLYEISKLSKLYLKDEQGNKLVFIFSHLDGMYSYSYLESDKDNVAIHLKCNTPLRKYKDGYKIKESKNE